jgi:hypothetical protein
MGSVHTSKMHSRRANPLCILQGCPILQQHSMRISKLSKQVYMCPHSSSRILLKDKYCMCLSCIDFESKKIKFQRIQILKIRIIDGWTGQ